MVDTVKGFSLANEAEVDVFQECTCFFYEPMELAIFLPFLIPACISEALGPCTAEASLEGV